MSALFIMSTVSVVLFLLLGAAIYVIFNQDKKLSIYTKWILEYRTKIDETYARLKSVDERNLFEKDDDVGFVFSELLRVMKEFDEDIQ